MIYGGNTKKESYILSTSTFKRHIAKVVVEIANPTVVEVVQDIRVTFPDMLGTIGQSGNVILATITLNYFRRHHRPIHWPQPDQCGGSYLLDLHRNSKLCREALSEEKVGQ